MFTVSAFTAWSDHDGRRFTGFPTKADAVDFARDLPDPLVDVIDTSIGVVVAARRLVAFPVWPRPDPTDPFVPRDDFPRSV